MRYPLVLRLMMGTAALVALASGCRKSAAPSAAGGAHADSTDVVHADGTWQAPNGVSLYEQSWRPAQAESVRAVVIVQHGLKDHSDRYADAAAELCGHGYAVHAFDLPGYGRSDGEHQYVDSFDEYLDDEQAFIERVRAAEPDLPVFLFGHSMGGAIATLTALTRTTDLNGLLLSGAALQSMPALALIAPAVQVASQLTPHLPLVPLLPTDFSRDPQVVLDMIEDPLIDLGKLPARLAGELFNAMAEVQASQTQLTMPLLAMHGTADRLTNPAGSQTLVDQASSADKQLKLYDGLYHDLLHEPEHETVLADMLAWLDARVP